MTAMPATAPTDAKPAQPAPDTRSHALVHARIMLRRNLRHMRRYPSLTLMIIMMPIVFLLLFVYVFGGTLGSGLGSGMPAGMSGGRAAYANYVAPAIILMAVVAAAQGTAIAVAQDMTEGIIARFRTMAVVRSSVLTGHVVGAAIQTMIGVTVVTAAAIAVGFRPHAGPVEGLAAVGVILLLTFAVTWLCVGLGLSAKSVETASNSPMFLLILPFVGSGFVPTDSLPVADALVRRVRTVHPDHRDAARAADRNEDRRQPRHHGHLVRRGRGAVVRLVPAAL